LRPESRSFLCCGKPSIVVEAGYAGIVEADDVLKAF
jgi:hypothetical protein